MTSKFLDALRSVKKGGKALQVCPRCGSAQLKRYGSYSGWLLPTQYVCGECGYSGSVVVEVPYDDDDSKQVESQ